MPARPDKDARQDRLAWLVGGIGLILILGVLAVVTVDAFRHDDPADLRVAEVSRRQAAGGTAVEIQIVNRGGQAAAGVAVSAESLADPALTAAVDIDYVAGHSRRRATVVFDADPGPLRLGVEGWSEP